jgi:hypothetical protein
MDIMSDDDKVKERLIAKDIAVKLIDLETRLEKLEKGNKPKLPEIKSVKYTANAF